MIRGLTTKVFADFRGGRVTNANLAAMPEVCCLIARDLFFLGDLGVTKRNGYTLVQQPWAGSVIKMYDFQRDLDRQQFLIVNGIGKLAWIDPHGTGPVHTLTANEDAMAAYDFAKNVFALYGSNGKSSKRFVDVGGTLTAYQWGLTPPTTAPTIANGAGTLTLLYGRQYVYCPVAKYTDSTGVQRVHIGAPSPISAHTGPLTSKVITVGAIPNSADLQVTHWWIFATVDAPLNSTSAFYFAAEITDGTTSWGDSLPDVDLDTTRQAPWQNYPAPLAELLVPYQSRIAALRIPGSPHLVQLSGFEEIDLGIPQEAWPPSLAFEVPGEKHELTGGAEFMNALMLGTPDYWFAVTGYDAQTFRKRDKIVTPGPVGKKAYTVTPRHLVWLSQDKKLWAWDGVSEPIEVSSALKKPLLGVLSMEDLSASQLANAEVKWFSFGRYKFILVLASTTNSPAGFDWIQVWDVSSMGEQLTDGSLHLLAESDMLPADVMKCSTIVQVDSTPYLFLADLAGNIHRFPDGFQDNGQPIRGVLGTVWSALAPNGADGGDVVKRLYWADLITDRNDAVTAFQMHALTSDTPNMEKALQGLPALDPVRSPYGIDPMAARANLQGPGTSVGKWFRCVVRFPEDDKAATLQRIAVSAIPVYGVNP